MGYAMTDKNYGKDKTRIFSFGKVDYNYYPGKKRRRINEICLEITLYADRNGYPEFTACADVWNNLHTDIVAGGQMIDELYNQFPRFHSNTIYKTIKELWEKYHCKDVSNIPDIDRQKMDLLFSDKERSEIVEALKEFYK